MYPLVFVRMSKNVILTEKMAYFPGRQRSAHTVKPFSGMFDLPVTSRTIRYASLVLTLNVIDWYQLTGGSCAG